MSTIVESVETLNCLHCGYVSEVTLSFCESCGRPLHAVRAVCASDVAAYATHPGQKHSENQDAVGVAPIGNGVALAISDGVSTACRSRAAARLAVDVVLAQLQTEPREGETTLDRMNRALSRVHENVCSIPYDDPELSEPQCTIVAGLVEENVLTVGWAGDSRLYIVNASCCRQVTVDDSWINDQVKLGVPKQIAMQSKDAHCITQCVGMRDDAPEFHIDQVRLAQGDLVLLCSDGLWNYAESEKEMFALVRSGLNRLSADGATRVQQCAALVEAMVNFANAAGGHDNISVCGYLHEGFDSLS